MSDDVVVRPLDRIADMGGNLCRRKGDLRHLDLDYGGVRAAERKLEEQRGHACHRQGPSHGASYFSSAATCSACC